GSSRVVVSGGGRASQLSQRRQRYQRTPPISRTTSASSSRTPAASRPTSSWPATPQTSSSQCRRGTKRAGRVRTPGAGAGASATPRRYPLGGDALRGCSAREVEGLGDQLVGAPPRFVLVGDADHDDLVGSVGRGHLAQAGGHG